MPASAEAYAGRIQAIAPDLVVRTAVFNGDGLVNDVVIVNDRLVFRFAKNEYSITALASELQVLRAIRPHVRLAIPDPFYISRDAIAYELLRGETLSRELLLALDADAQQSIADQLGGFLRALHTAPIDGGLPRTLAPARYADWAEMRRKIEAAVYPLLLPHQRAWAQGLFDSMLADPRNFDYDPRLMHGDLGPYHILYDRAAGRLSAIIDFGTAGLGDPAGDLGGMLQIYGGSFVRRMFRVYPEARALMHRARFYAQAIGLQWAMLGFTRAETFWFTAHLGGAQDLLQDGDGPV